MGRRKISSFRKLAGDSMDSLETEDTQGTRKWWKTISYERQFRLLLLQSRNYFVLSLYSALYSRVMF